MSTSEYDAFICYSSVDAWFARALQRGLEHFESAMPWRRSMRCFRDEANLAADPSLQGAIQVALEQSSCLIIVASPSAARSEWVNREITYYLKSVASPKVLIALIEGDTPWTRADGVEEPTALPRALTGQKLRDPIVVDFRAAARAPRRKFRRRPEFVSGVASLVATIRGKDKDQIYGAHLRAQRLAIGGLSVGMVLMGALAAIAVVQKRNAKRAKLLAERRLKQAVSVAEHINFVVDGELGHLAGAAAVRKRLLHSSSELLDRLLGEGGLNAEVFRQRVVSEAGRSDIARSHGKLVEAREAAQRAVSFARQAVRLSPTGREVRQAATVALARLANVFRDEAEFEKAMEALREAQEIRIELVKEFPEFAHTHYDLAASEAMMGDLLVQVGMFAEAATQYESALERFQTMSKEVDDPDIIVNIATVLSKIGELREGEGRLSQALELFDRAVQHDRQLLEKQPDSAIRRRSLVASLQRLGDCQRDLGQSGKAIATFREGREISEKLAIAEPTSTDLRRVLSVLLSKEATQLGLDGDVERAVPLFERSLELDRANVTADPGNPDYRSNLASSLLNVAQIQRIRGDFAGATATLREAISLREQLTVQVPESPAYFASLGEVQRDLGEVLWLNDELDSAMETLARSRNALEEAKERAPAKESIARSRVATLMALGCVHDDGGKRAEAATAYEEARAISTEWLERLPGSPGMRGDLASTLEKLADLSLRRKEPKRARALSGEAIAIRRSLQQERPDDPDDVNSLANVLDLQARIELASNAPAQALRPAREMVKLRRYRLAAHVEDPGRRFFLALALNRLGEVQTRMARLTFARRAFEEAAHLVEAALITRGARRDYWKTLGRSREQLAALKARQGRSPLNERVAAVLAFGRSHALGARDWATFDELEKSEQAMFADFQRASLPVARAEYAALERAAAQVPADLPGANVRIHALLANVALDVLRDPKRALAASDRAIAGSDPPWSLLFCNNAEASLAASDDMDDVKRRAIRCIEHSSDKGEKLVGKAILYAVAVLGGDGRTSEEAAADLVAMHEELPPGGLGWSFKTSRAVLRAKRHPEGRRLDRLFAALELTDATARSAAIERALGHSTRLARP